MYGRKLHAELGRLATRVKISEMSLCCTLVSCRWVSMDMTPWCGSEGVYQLCVELCQAWLARIVEDEDRVNHDAGVCNKAG